MNACQRLCERIVTFENLHAAFSKGIPIGRPWPQVAMDGTSPRASRAVRGLFIAAAIHFLAGVCAYSQPVKAIGGFLDFNSYYDTRDFSVVTINSQLRMTRRLEYFSFVNYLNAPRTTRNLDLTGYYTEQNLRWALPSGMPLDMAGQASSSDGGKNDALRLGARWRASSTQGLERLFGTIHAFYAVTFFPVQFDSRDGHHEQIEHFYRMDLFPASLGKRAYLSGYADHNIGPGSPPWVTEHQIGIRLAGGLHAAVEYRYNGFLKDKNGLGLGLEYLASF